MNRLFLSTLILLGTLPAWSGDGDSPSFRIFGQTTTYFELNQAEDSASDEDYTKFKEMLSFNIEWSHWTLGIQGDYLYYSDPELVDRLDLDRLHDTWELRKYYIDYASDHFSGRLGTFFSSFGRGLTLYVQKNDALGFDEPIHGATATMTFDHVDVTAVTGTVTEPVLQNQYNRTFEDDLWGGHVLFRLPHNAFVGGSIVRSKLDRFFPQGVDTVDIWSIEGGIDGIGGVVDLYGEWAEVDQDLATGDRSGYGGYFSASGYIGPITILAEYKDYWNFDYRYNLPPNAGREIENYSHNDVKGPRLLVSADIMSIGAVIYGSYARFNSHKEESSLGGIDGDRQNEWYVIVEETVDPIYLEASYFNRRWLDRGLEQEHVIGDLHWAFAERDEVIFSYDKRLEQASYFELATHRSSLSYSRSPHGVVSLRYAWEEKSGYDTEGFWGLNVEYLPKPTMTLTLFGGEDPGGMVCAGGQCRIEPRFKGYKATFTWRF